MPAEEVLQEYCDLLEEGHWGKIWSVKTDVLRRICPQAGSVEGMVDQMADSKIAVFAALVSHIADRGDTDSHKFRSEADGLKAIAIKGKERQMYRYPAFRLKNNWVFVHGFVKARKAKWDEKHTAWANLVRMEIITKIGDDDEQA